MKLNKLGSIVAATAMCASVLTVSASAADFPGSKSITIVCPYAAGGASDTTSRIFASEFEKAIGTTVMVQNTTGASGAIGLETVRNSNPDGYTIAYMPVESTMLAALGYSDLTTNDFRFIGRAMTIPAAITVNADSEWQTFDDFIAYAKEHPGEVRVGNSGTGSIWQVAAASVEDVCGVEFNHVPFSDGAASAVTALLGNNIEAVAVSPSEVYTNVEAGDLRTLAVLGDEASSVLPDVSTATELGYDIVIQGWGGFAVPKDTPDDVVEILEKAAETAINSDAMKELLASKGYEHAYLSGADMDAKAAEELAYYTELIPSMGIVME
ncbi:MAG: tripartite tricarboxylate transporter substrate binding protein [Lachnospiraceae bacterium]|nr:tripartite tricarboxylate transporter substrate binding protein [Lachnospiraceae bacterium]MDD3796568.1 tripartite tricarboxylate transporter substrate binding protein [Lachnospiraceae bacterium]